MHKSFKIAIFAAVLPLAACVTPTGQDYLQDASATCGSRDMFSGYRTFESTTSVEGVDRIYNCVNDYLNNLPEYKALGQTQTADRQFVANMRQIDTMRARGQLTPEQAQVQARAAVSSHGGMVD